MNRCRETEIVQKKFLKSVLRQQHNIPFSLTPIIVTFYPGYLTSIHIRNFLENGLKIIRFKMCNLTNCEKKKMLNMIKDALSWYSEKYNVTNWPVAISIDIPNACIQTGRLKDADINAKIEINDNSIVEVTSDPKLRCKCDSNTIYINDEYTLKTVPIGTEITICFGIIVIVVIEVIDEYTLKCKVIRGGAMGSHEYVCIRGVRYLKPSLNKTDLELIKFAIEFKLDIIIIHSVRKITTLQRIKKVFTEAGKNPLFLSSICEQEGLDNFDEILKESDGIILARQFLAHQIVNTQRMITIQLHISAKCKLKGIPFFISGNVLENTLMSGSIKGTDLNDLTNGVMQSAGFVLANYKDPDLITLALKYMEPICKAVEPLTTNMQDFWRISEEVNLPATAADACILACALLAKVTDAKVIIMTSVSGKTAAGISQITPDTIIVLVTTSPKVARQSQIRRGIIPLVYNRPRCTHWWHEMKARIKYGMTYCLKYAIMTYDDNYVAFTKSLPTSAYNDYVSSWAVSVKDDMSMN